MDKYLENIYKTYYRFLCKFQIINKRYMLIATPNIQKAMLEGEQKITTTLSRLKKQINEDLTQIEEEIRGEEDNYIQEIEEKLKQDKAALLMMADEVWEKYLINHIDPDFENNDISNYRIFLNELYYSYQLNCIGKRITNEESTEAYVNAISSVIMYIEKLLINYSVALNNPHYVVFRDYLSNAYKHYSMWKNTLEDEKKQRLGISKETC